MDLVHRRTSRRSFVALLGLALAGCAAPAAPASTAAPAKPTSAPAPAPKPTTAPTASGNSGAAANPTADAAAHPNVGPATTGASAGAAIDKALDGYYQAAKASGQMKVTHYGPGDELAPVIETFKKRFPGLEVEAVLLRGPEMIQRINAEAASGKYVANIASTGETTMSGLEKLGRLVQWQPAGTERLPAPELPSDSYRYMYTVNIFGVVVNTEKVPADRIPKTRKDLLDPYWKGKGKLFTEDPRAAGPGQSFWVITYDDLGADFLTQMKAQDMTFTRDRNAAPAQVARGEYNVYWPYQLNDEMLDLQQKAPIKVTFFQDGGAHYDNSTFGIVKDAPGQDAAKLWAQWLISDEGQRSIATESKQFPVVAGMPAPPGWPSFDEIKPRPRTADQRNRNEEYIKNLDQLFFG